MSETPPTTLLRSNLARAKLLGARFEDCLLIDVDFSHASFGSTIFVNVSLAQAKGLESCKHAEPSFLDHQTLLKSGVLPTPFLRGCGLPDVFIEYLPSMLKEPIYFYSCFISYSSKDEEFATQLHADLQSKGVRCWFAPHDIQGGKKLHEQIDHAIRIHKKVLLILSPDSMNSEWVKTEIAKARRREIEENDRVLFPIRLVGFSLIRQWECFDADTGKDSAREVREYFIPDFSNWTDPLSYKAAFERLLKDLRGEGSKEVAAP
jgi:hypothetical protein